MRHKPKYNLLDHKDEWVEALQKTIDKYNQCIRDRTPYINDQEDCALCAFDDYLADRYNYWSMCEFCIHMSEFSEGEICSSQASFAILNVEYNSEELLIDRRDFLVEILGKLIKAKPLTKKDK